MKKSLVCFTLPLAGVASCQPNVKPLIGSSISHSAGPERSGSAADRSESRAEDGAYADSQRCDLAGQGQLDVMPGRQLTGLSAFSEKCVAYRPRSDSMFFNVRWPTAPTRAAVTVKTARLSLWQGPPCSRCRWMAEAQGTNARTQLVFRLINRLARVSAPLKAHVARLELRLIGDRRRSRGQSNRQPPHDSACGPFAAKLASKASRTGCANHGVEKNRIRAAAL
jgi:hypothetical protein